MILIVWILVDARFRERRHTSTGPCRLKPGQDDGCGSIDESDSLEYAESLDLSNSESSGGERKIASYGFQRDESDGASSASQSPDFSVPNEEVFDIIQNVNALLLDESEYDDNEESALRTESDGDELLLNYWIVE